MIMKVLNVNYEKSMEYFNICKDVVSPNECYENCFRVLMDCSELSEDFEANKLKVAYSYMHTIAGICVRHCVLLHEEYGLIDVTRMLQEGLTEDIKRKTEYYIFDTLECEEYYRIIDKNEGYTDYKEAPNELDFFKNLQIKSVFYSINEHDFITYIIPKLKKENLKGC